MIQLIIDLIPGLWFALIVLVGGSLCTTTLLVMTQMKKTKISEFFLVIFMLWDTLKTFSGAFPKAIRYLKIVFSNDYSHPMFSDLISCKIIAIISFLSFGGTMLVLFVIAQDRYLLILHRNVYLKFVMNRQMRAVVVFVFLHLSILSSCCIVVSLGIGCTIIFDTQLYICTIAPGLFKALLIDAFSLISLALMLLLYGQIFVFYRKQQKKISSIVGDTSDSGDKRVSRSDIKLVKNLFIMMFVYGIQFVPLSLTNLFPDQVDNFTYRIVFCIAYTSAVTDPVIYIVTNKPVREKMINYFLKLRKR